MTSDKNALTSTGLSFKEMPFSAKENFSDEKLIFNVKYEVRALEDFETNLISFKEGETKMVTGLFAKQLIRHHN